MRVSAVVVLTVIAAMAAGCAGGDDGCERLQGNYEVTYDELEGDCGADFAAGIAETVNITSSDSFTADSGSCARSGQESGDQCSVDFEQSCPVRDGSILVGRIRTVGTLEGARDGSSASGTWLFELRDEQTGESCSSRGEVTYERL